MFCSICSELVIGHTDFQDKEKKMQTVLTAFEAHDVIVTASLPVSQREWLILWYTGIHKYFSAWKGSRFWWRRLRPVMSQWWRHCLRHGAIEYFLILQKRILLATSVRWRQIQGRGVSGLKNVALFGGVGNAALLLTPLKLRGLSWIVPTLRYFYLSIFLFVCYVASDGGRLYAELSDSAGS